MKTTLVLVLPLLLLISSCCGTHTEVKYAYSDVTIFRVDECAKTTFYYQKGADKAPGKIWCEYSGINDGFSGYLKFHKNGKVELLSGDGYFQSKGIDTALFEYRSILDYERPELEESVCVIMLATNYEQERNKQFNSGIKFAYNVDTNDWW